MMGDGVVFHIEGWKWKSETEVEITCGYYEHPLSASHSRYTLVRDEGRWTVEGDVRESIS